ncbi:MAG: LPS export ABC transporter periplasmic protein LptC [Thermodesulfobacteria bacterium]|nr:LPS export ABC transporter periplasmic protein LptC [Thermodesulfobacteriota bacterium]
MLRSLGALLFCLILLGGCHQEPKALKPVEPQKTSVPGTPSEKTKPEEKKAPAEGTKPQPATPEEKEKEEPNTEFKKLHYVIYEKGKLKWDIFAEKAEVYRGNEVHLEDLRVCSSPERGFCITSRRGVYDPRQGTFFFQGNVVLRSKHQGSLKTSHLSYLPKKELLETGAKVTIDKKGLVIRGEGFVYDLRSGVMKVLKRTEVKVDG